MLLTPLYQIDSSTTIDGNVEFVQKLVKKIRKDVIKLRKEIELAEQTIEQSKTILLT